MNVQHCRQLPHVTVTTSIITENMSMLRIFSLLPMWLLDLLLASNSFRDIKIENKTTNDIEISNSFKKHIHSHKYVHEPVIVIENSGLVSVLFQYFYKNNVKLRFDLKY